MDRRQDASQTLEHGTICFVANNKFKMLSIGLVISI